MKKFLAILVLLLVAAAGSAVIAWSLRASIAAQLLSRQLNVPVSIASLDLSTNQALISNLWIGNPPRSRTNTAFTAQTIDIESTLQQIRGEVMTIDLIEASQLFVGIELYGGSKSDNNWAHIAQQDKKSEKKGRDYLIRKLVLNNLTVQVTQPDGTVKTYPTIPRMEFYNISSETGFPIGEIEKAIFNLMMKNLFQRLNLNQLIDTLNPFSSSPAAPLQLLPKLFGS